MPAINLVVLQTQLYRFVVGSYCRLLVDAVENSSITAAVREAAPLRMKKIDRKPSGGPFASFSVAVTPLSAPSTMVGDATARVRLVPSLLIVNAREVLLAADVGSPAKLALSE